MVKLHKVKIENLTDRIRSLRLSSGTVLHLPPRTTSEALPKVEIQNNAEAEKLLARRAITIHDVTGPAATGTNPERTDNPSLDVATENL